MFRFEMNSFTLVRHWPRNLITPKHGVNNPTCSGCSMILFNDFFNDFVVTYVPEFGLYSYSISIIAFPKVLVL